MGEEGAAERPSREVAVREGEDEESEFLGHRGRGGNSENLVRTNCVSARLRILVRVRDVAESEGIRDDSK
jgi:hypothetical protein